MHKTGETMTLCLKVIYKTQEITFKFKDKILLNNKSNNS